ncbi:MAG: hypothetical protein LC642_03320 [Verrucomicrobiaceae bacterium]|nr:hypothetical protein [Verrucomicrobiaceae bacterium]
MSHWLEALPSKIGQIFVAAEANGTIALCHRDDRERDGLTTHGTPEAAIQIARFDDAGEYRPLKTAPNLRHGWRLLLGSPEDAQLALDYFYPGRAAAYRAWRAGALRTILWQRDASGAPASRLLPTAKFDPAFDQTGRGEDALPLLCQEPCNLLVAELRKAVKE